MGLLDDAIREHLELKRMRGADPGEVTREEQEALGPPVYADDTAAEDPQGAYLDGAEQAETADATHALAADDPFDQLLDDDDAFEDDHDDQLPASHPGDLVAHVSGDQETAEVDMQAMLDSEELEDEDLERGPSNDDDSDEEELEDDADSDDEEELEDDADSDDEEELDDDDFEDDLSWDEPPARSGEELE